MEEEYKCEVLDEQGKPNPFSVSDIWFRGYNEHENHHVCLFHYTELVKNGVISNGDGYKGIEFQYPLSVESKYGHLERCFSCNKYYLREDMETKSVCKTCIKIVAQQKNLKGEGTLIRPKKIIGDI